jgi:hypothetical protein
MKWLQKLSAFVRRWFKRSSKKNSLPTMTQPLVAAKVASLYNPDFSRQIDVPTLEKFGEAKLKRSVPQQYVIGGQLSANKRKRMRVGLVRDHRITVIGGRWSK